MSKHLFVLDDCIEFNTSFTDFNDWKRTSPNTRSPHRHTTHQHGVVDPSLVGWGTNSPDSATETQ